MYAKDDFTEETVSEFYNKIAIFKKYNKFNNVYFSFYSNLLDPLLGIVKKSTSCKIFFF